MKEEALGRVLFVALATGLLPPQIQAAEESGQDQDGCTEIVSGAFVASSTTTDVSVGMCSGNRYLRFEDGPRNSLEHADYIGESYKCADRDTGLDHLVLGTACLGSGCVPDYRVYRANAEKKAMERVFSVEFMEDYEWLHRPLVTANGECLWRGVAKAEAALDAALAPLLVGREQDGDPWDLKPGETLALSPRRLPAAAVVGALGAIGLYGDSTMLPLCVNVLGAKHLSDVARADLFDAPQPELEPNDRTAFQVLQVQRRTYCGDTGALLVGDKRDRTWTAFRDFGAGDCGRGGAGGYDESMDFLHVKDGTLYAKGGAAHGHSWFEVDLRGHTARRLLEVPRFIADVLADM